MKPPARHPWEYAPSGGAPPSAWITCFGMSGFLSAAAGTRIASGRAAGWLCRGSSAKSARRDLPDRLDPAAAHADYLVGEVAARAGMERVEAQPLAERHSRVSYRAPHAVLLGQPLDHDAAVG